MKQSLSWGVLLAQISIVTSIASALVTVRGICAGGEPIRRTADWSEMQVGGHL